MANRTLLFVAALLTPLCALAATADRQKPVNLRADRIEIDQKKGTSLYRGQVLLTQGTLRMTATRAEARNRGTKVETVTAEGKPVTFRQRPEGGTEYVQGQAGRVHYRVPEQLVDFGGNVTLQRGRDTFRAALANYDIAKRHIVAEGNAEQRAYVALVPRTRLSASEDDSKNGGGRPASGTAVGGQP